MKMIDPWEMDPVQYKNLKNEWIIGHSGGSELEIQYVAGICFVFRVLI